MSALTRAVDAGILPPAASIEELIKEMSLRRMAAVVRKEIFHIVRDPRNLFLVVVSPALLLFLLSYVFSFDVGQLSLAALNLDHSALSRAYLANLTSDQDLRLATHLTGYAEAVSILKSGEADAVLVIPPGFSVAILEGKPTRVQTIVDGADPFSGGQALMALEARSRAFVANAGMTTFAQVEGPIEIRTVAWYNAGLESLFSMVPGLLAIVLIMPTMAMALALAREKETGTLEGLIVTPISGPEYLGGKLLAYIAAGLASALLALLVAVLWFRVPFRGSLLVYLLLTGVYLMACMGAAILVANFVRSQQTAMFVVLLVFLVPSFFLAGLIMPVAAQSLEALLTSSVLPTTHFVEIARGLFLKGLGMRGLAQPALILLGMGLGAWILGLKLFEKKVS
jgi:ABC-2 type transport system permease protein